MGPHGLELRSTNMNEARRPSPRSLHPKPILDHLYLHPQPKPYHLLPNHYRHSATLTIRTSALLPSARARRPSRNFRSCCPRWGQDREGMVEPGLLRATVLGEEDKDRAKGDVWSEDGEMFGEETIGEGPREEEDVRMEDEPPQREDQPRQRESESPPHECIDPDPGEEPTYWAHHSPEEQEHHPMDLGPDTRTVTLSPPPPSSPLSAPPASPLPPLQPPV
ncbi:hypothetical protein DXG01_006204 [Tephrocybe rancida]|nr:hypothetical protein DXG01_006204 [Tephrocybe rancida]